MIKFELNVAVSGEIIPKDILQTAGNYYLLLTIAKSERLKKFTV